MKNRQATLTEAFESFVSLIDDAAALGDKKEAQYLEDCARVLVEVAKLRREGILERLSGDIECALACEEQADKKLRTVV